MEDIIKPFGINLYGGLARAFKKKYNFNPKNIPIIANSVNEIMRAMSANFPGFRELIRKKGYYKVVKGEDLYTGDSLTKDELEVNFKEKVWHLFPIAAGSKGGAGTIQIILGAVIFIAGAIVAFNPYYPNPALGYPMMVMGAGMMMGGLIQMLTPMPKLPENKGGGDEPSYLFNGAINQAAPGITVPLAYGETWIGGIPISFGVDVRDIGSDSTPPAPPAPPPVYTPPSEPTEPSDPGGGGGEGPTGGATGLGPGQGQGGTGEMGGPDGSEGMGGGSIGSSQGGLGEQGGPDGMGIGGGGDGEGP